MRISIVGGGIAGLHSPLCSGSGALSFILEAEAGAAFDELTRSGRDDILTRQTKSSWPNIFRRPYPLIAQIGSGDCTGTTSAAKAVDRRRSLRHG